MLICDEWAFSENIYGIISLEKKVDETELIGLG